jgi:type II secretory pathway component PulF
MGAVLWGFLGVRKDRAMARDVRAIKPAQLIVVGVLVAAVLVFTLMLIARLITSGL